MIAKVKLTHYDLESEIHNVRNMADLTTDVLEDVFGGANDLGEGRYSITDDELRKAMFAVYHTSALADALYEKWKAVHESQGGVS